MNRRNIFRYFLLPTLVGLLATSAVYLYIAPTATRMVEAEDMLDVVFAAQTVPAKTQLTSEMLEVRSVPVQYVPRGALQALADAVGRVTTVPLAEGEILLSGKLTGEETKTGLAYHVPPGHRAISIPVNEISGVGGFLQPGDRVDVIVSFTDPADETEKRGISVLEMQNLLLLAVGPSMEVPPGGAGDPSTYTHVTLAVLPDQAVKLTTLDRFTTVRLVLRPAVDQGETTPRHRSTTEEVWR
ncbi:MAG TPA: Flp pilus assembly protein CpaB [Bacillota bacterium]